MRKWVKIVEGSDDHLHGEALRKTGFWGNAGAGCIFLARDTGRILIAHRSVEVEQPNTWGTWGGAIDRGESPLAAAQREAQEETGHSGPFEFVSLYLFSSNSFRYYNYLCIVNEEFIPKLDWETQGYRWCEWGDWPHPLHFGLVSLLKDPESVDRIQEILESILD